jgi:hypothetical protein
MTVGSFSRNLLYIATKLANGKGFLFFLLSFSLDEKETKNQDKQELPRSWSTLARIFVGPTLAK